MNSLPPRNSSSQTASSGPARRARPAGSGEAGSGGSEIARAGIGAASPTASSPRSVTVDPADERTAKSLRVNGESWLGVAATLADLLVEAGYTGAKVATARNGDFVPERLRGQTLLQDGDQIEIVAPRQGG